MKVPGIRANRARDRMILKMLEVETQQGDLCLCHCLNVLAVEFSQVWTFLSLVQDNYLFFSHHTSNRIASSIAASIFYFKAKE